MKETVDKQRLGFVATVSAAVEPNVSPKGTFVVINDQTLAFGAIRSPGTVANIRHHPEIEVNFVDPLRSKGFRARGEASVHARASDAYREHRARFDRWGAMANRIEEIVLIDVRWAKPLSSPAFDDGTTEAELRAQWTSILLSQ